jgi:hypothetical protein
MSEYTHRNGEGEPPTEQGFFWTQGRVEVAGDKIYVAGTVFFCESRDGEMFLQLQDGRLVNNGAYCVGTYDGKWDCRFWGPVIPPWWEEVVAAREATGE